MGAVPVTDVRSDGVWRAARANLSGGIPEIVEQVLRDKQDENTYCLTGECSRDVERCLTKCAPVASLILRPSRSSFSDL